MNPEREVLIRLGASLAIFGAMAGWEFMAPCRALTSSKPRRWLRNLALAALNALSIRLVLPAGALTLAWVAARHGWGLVHHLAVPLPVAFLLSILVLDLTVYLQHVALHACLRSGASTWSTTPMSTSTSRPATASTRWRSSCR